MQQVITRFVLALAFIVAHSQAEAQVPRNCEAALIADVELTQISERTRIAFLQTIDSSNFEQIKNSAGFGASIPIEGIPLSAFANFEQFNEARRRYIESVDLRFDRDLAVLYVAQRVPQRAFTAFSQCIEADARQRYGLHLIPRQLGDDVVQLTIHWRPTPPTTATRLSVNIEILDGSETIRQQVRLPANAFEPLTHRRRSEGGMVLITASGGGIEPVTIRVPAVDREPPLLPACRHPSHGVERFGREYPVVRSVDDRPGGEHCENWCAAWQGELLRSLPAGSQVQPRMPCSHHVRRVIQGCCPPTERIIYKFECVLDVRTEPVFRLARTDACR